VQANLLSALVENPEALNQAYNVAVGGETTLNDLFELVRGLLAQRLPQLRGVRPVHREVRKGDVAFTRADIGKAQRLLGFKPLVSVAQGLESTIEWYAEELGAATAPLKRVAHA
jgi:UDP-N-acetylglucosamine 4-epimerase